MANNHQYPGIQPFQHANLSSIDLPRGFAPSMNFQFRPTIQAPQSEQVTQFSSQNFQCVGRGGTALNIGFPPQSYVPQLPSMHHSLERPSHANQVQALPLGVPTLISQPNVPVASATSLPQSYLQTPDISMAGFGGPRPFFPYPSATSYDGSRAPAQVVGPSSHGQAQQRAPTSQTTALSSIMNSTFEQPKAAFFQPKPSQETLTDWIEHTSADGKRYFFNKRTKQSTWEKPAELMTLFEKADARTDWREHLSPDGRMYYYNKVTKHSTWTLPEEMKIAREQGDKPYKQGSHAEGIIDASKVLSCSNTATTTALAGLPNQTSSTLLNSDVSEKLVITSDPKEAASVPGSSSPVENVARVQMIADKTSQLHDRVETDDPSVVLTTTAATLVDKDKTSTENGEDSDDMSAKNANQGSESGPKESEKHVVESRRVDNQSEEKPIHQDNFSYNNKLEAADVFKSLLKSVNVGADWTWEQAMREIINDRRYGVLRTLGERKQAFNEFLVQTKRAAEEERLARQKKRYEDFKQMLEECVELTPSTRWSKAVTMFEADERFKALEREKDRRNIFEDHVSELKEKERVKSLEDHKRNIIEYKRFLESCNFIKPNSQWRKVQDRLEVDERCSRLEKIDQLEIFQEYLRDLEREEEEKKKIQKEELKKAERKHRDEFRGLIDEHIATGELTAKTSWRDYLLKVRDLPVYLAIASNSSGATPKDLFEDAVEDLKTKHYELKSQIKDVLKLRKVMLSVGSTFDEFKVSISEGISIPIPDVKLKLVFDDLLERAKEKEEKEARKQTRHTEKLVDMLRSIKDITASSSWEESKYLVEGSEKCRSIGDERFRRQKFEEYVLHLKEKSQRIKQNKKVLEDVREEHEKGKDKYGREKERMRERVGVDHHKKGSADNYNHDMIEPHGKERRRSGRDSHNRHRERHNSLKQNDLDHFKGSHKAGSGHKASRQERGSMLEAADEGREKRRRKEEEELEDGECGSY